MPQNTPQECAHSQVTTSLTIASHKQQCYWNVLSNHSHGQLPDIWIRSDIQEKTQLELRTHLDQVLPSRTIHTPGSLMMSQMHIVGLTVTSTKISSRPSDPTATKWSLSQEKPKSLTALSMSIWVWTTQTATRTHPDSSVLATLTHQLKPPSLV